jgi:hypothetical protein
VLLNKLREVEFGDPDLREVRLAIKCELDGVAFIKGHENTVKFTFYSQVTGSLSLTMKDLVQAQILKNKK